MGRREFQLARGTLLRRRNHRAIEMGGIGVRDDYVGFQFRSIFQANARGPPIFDNDGINRGIELNLDAVSLHQTAKGGRDRPSSAHREVHAVSALEKMNEPVDAGRIKWVASNQQGLD